MNDDSINYLSFLILASELGQDFLFFILYSLFFIFYILYFIFYFIFFISRLLLLEGRSKRERHAAPSAVTSIPYLF